MVAEAAAVLDDLAFVFCGVDPDITGDPRPVGVTDSLPDDISNSIYQENLDNALLKLYPLISSAYLLIFWYRAVLFFVFTKNSVQVIAFAVRNEKHANMSFIFRSNHISYGFEVLAVFPNP